MAPTRGMCLRICVSFTRRLYDRTDCGTKSTFVARRNWIARHLRRYGRNRMGAYVGTEMTGTADILATAIFALIGLGVAGSVIWWVADKFIEAIDWMTRNE